MNKDKLQRNIKIKNNGKISISLKRNYSGLTTGGMKVDETALHISETKINSPRLDAERKFMLSLRSSNKSGEHKLTQLNCTEEDLADIREVINMILDTTYQEDKIKSDYEEYMEKIRFMCFSSKYFK